MAKIQCKAKDPYNCRFHSSETENREDKNIKYYKAKITTARSFAEREESQINLDKAVIRKDASLTGFQKLSKELTKAIKTSDVEKQAELATRINKASRLRLLDGKDSLGVWSSSQNDTFAFGSKILELSEKNDTVEIPWGLSGTQDMGIVAKRIILEGNKVTSLNLYSTFNDSSITQETLKAAETKAISYIENSRNATGLYEELRGGEIACQGFTFEDKTGRKITVVPSLDIDREESEKLGY